MTPVAQQNSGGGMVCPYMLQSTWVVMGEGGGPTLVPTLHSDEKLKNVNVKNTFYMSECKIPLLSEHRSEYLSDLVDYGRIC